MSCSVGRWQSYDGDGRAAHRPGVGVRVDDEHDAGAGRGFGEHLHGGAGGVGGRGGAPGAAADPGVVLHVHVQLGRHESAPRTQKRRRHRRCVKTEAGRGAKKPPANVNTNTRGSNRSTRGSSIQRRLGGGGQKKKPANIL